MMEYWDIYDKDRNLTGKIIRRGDTFEENEVIDAKWVTRSKVAKMIEEGVVVKSVVKRYGFYGDKLNI